MIYKNYKIKDILSERSFELKLEDEFKKDEENLENNTDTSEISSLSNIDLIDYFCKDKSLNVKIQNNQNVKSLQHLLKISTLFKLTEESDDSLLESYKLSKILIENKKSKSKNVEDFIQDVSNYLRQSVYSPNLDNPKEFSCDYFHMISSKEKDKTIVLIEVFNLLDLINESSRVSKSFGHVCEDLVCSSFINNYEFIPNKEKLYVSILLMILKEENNLIDFSTFANKLKSQNIVFYKTFLNKYKNTISSSNIKDILNNIIPNGRLIDANKELYKNCEFDFILVNDKNESSLIDLKSHKENSSSFSSNTISGSESGFAYAIKTLLDKKEYKDLKFNSICLIKFERKINSSYDFELVKSEVRVSNLDEDMISLFEKTISSEKSKEKKTLSLKNCSVISSKEDESPNFLEEFVTISKETLEEIQRKEVDKINSTFGLDSDYNITFDNITEINESNLFEVKNSIYQILTKLKKGDEDELYFIFSDENKIKVLEFFTRSKIYDGTKDGLSGEGKLINLSKRENFTKRSLISIISKTIFNDENKYSNLINAISILDINLSNSGQVSSGNQTYSTERCEREFNRIREEL